MPASSDTIDYASLQSQYEFDVYAKRGLTLVRGSGATVWDVDGREYIDASGAYGVAGVGHCHPDVASAIARQAQTLISCPGAYYSDVRARLMEKLVAIAPDSIARVFLCNSGTEAIEAAIKFARFATKRTEFVCAMKGFHGRTLGALSATFNPDYKRDFGPLPPGFSHVPFNNLEKLEAAVNDQTAGVILEVVQGEGGVNLGTVEFLHGAQGICRSRGALFILDEIQTGFGRTGRMFGAEHHGLEPDIMCLAKALAGGLPMGATLCADSVEVPVGRHGSTFGGNPLCCAAALATIGVIERDQLAERARALGDAFAMSLRRHDLPRVREIRQLGLMIGIELKEKVAPILHQLLERGIIALPAGTTVLRLLPPLVISEEQMARVETAIIEVLRGEPVSA